MDNKNKSALNKRIKSFGYAFKGIGLAFKFGWNIVIQLLCAIAVVIAGFIFNISVYEWLAVVFCIGLVIAFEIINTAIEKIVDFISPGYHKQAGIIKDLAAGAVLVTAILSVVIAGIIFVPKLINCL